MIVFGVSMERANGDVDYAGWTDKIVGDQYPAVDGMYKVYHAKSAYCKSERLTCI
jgi:hypothetical protein